MVIMAFTSRELPQRSQPHPAALFSQRAFHQKPIGDMAVTDWIVAGLPQTCAMPPGVPAETGFIRR